MEHVAKSVDIRAAQLCFSVVEVVLSHEQTNDQITIKELSEVSTSLMKPESHKITIGNRVKGPLRSGKSL